MRYDEAGRREFRRQFGLAGKFVVMYSGNHSPCHPLDTLLAAAERLRGDPRFAFCFVGGGSLFETVRRFAGARRLENIVCVPYQPEERLGASLSAADLHVVVMGEKFVGIVHPSKIYNVLALGIPVLYIGPAESHVTELASASARGRWFFEARHGEVERVVGHVLAAESAARRGDPDELEVAALFSHRAVTAQLGACIGGEAKKKNGTARARSAPRDSEFDELEIHEILDSAPER